MDEVWLPVSGYEGLYEVSSEGRVRRVAGSVKCPSGRILKIKFSTNSYRLADLSSEGKVTRFYVHRLVATAFLGQPIGGAEVNHKDGDKTNNKIENLEWVTHTENVRHSFRSLPRADRDNRGSNNPRAKLTESQVEKIRELKGVVSQRVLAQQYGVSKTAIRFIHQGKHWKKR